MERKVASIIKPGVRTDGYLSVLRKDHGTPIIEIDRPWEFARKVAALGLGTGDVFYKGLCQEGSMGLVGPQLRKRSRFRDYGSDRLGSIMMVREFKQLSLMHSILPEHTVRPIALGTYDSRVVGYFLEYITAKDGWETLISISSRDKQRALREKIISAVRKFHKRGVGHGDLTFLVNVFVTKDGRILFYDPRRRPGENNKDLIKRDNRQIKNNFEW